MRKHEKDMQRHEKDMRRRAAMSIRLTHRETDLETRIYRKKKLGTWTYIPAGKEAQDITPQQIAGDIGYADKGEPAAYLAVDGGEEPGEELPVSPFMEKPGFTQKLVGDIPCEDKDGTPLYVRIIGRNWLKILLPLLILAALVAGGILWYLSQNSGPRLDENAIAYQMPNGMKNEDPSQIMLPGFGTIEMEAGQRTVEAALVNPEGNPCYFKYSISLEESGEVIYESGWLEPGTAVTEWAISEELEPGDHPISILVDTGSLEDYEQEMNKGTIKATLRVEQRVEQDER